MPIGFSIFKTKANSWLVEVRQSSGGVHLLDCEGRYCWELSCWYHHTKVLIISSIRRVPSASVLCFFITMFRKANRNVQTIKSCSYPIISCVLGGTVIGHNATLLLFRFNRWVNEEMIYNSNKPGIKSYWHLQSRSWAQDLQGRHQLSSVAFTLHFPPKTCRIDFVEYRNSGNRNP